MLRISFDLSYIERMTSIEPVRTLISEAQSKLLQLEQQADRLRAQIEAYEQVVAIFCKETSDRPRVTQAHQDFVKEQLVVANEIIAGKRGRGLSPLWKSVLDWIIAQNSPPDNDAIHNWIISQGHTVQRNSLRAQLFGFVQKGYLMRSGTGYAGRKTATGKTYGAKASSLSASTDEPKLWLGNQGKGSDPGVMPPWVTAAPDEAEAV